MINLQDISTATSTNQTPFQISSQALLLIGKDDAKVQQQLMKGAKAHPDSAEIMRVGAIFYHYNRQYDLCIQCSTKAIQIIKEHNTNNSNGELENEQNSKQENNNGKQEIQDQLNERILKDCQFLCSDSWLYMKQIQLAQNGFTLLLEQQNIKNELNNCRSILYSQADIEHKLKIINSINSPISLPNTQIDMSFSRKIEDERMLIENKMTECENKGYLKKVGMPVYIISIKWYRTWQKYVGIIPTNQITQTDNTSNDNGHSQSNGIDTLFIKIDGTTKQSNENGQLSCINHNNSHNPNLENGNQENKNQQNNLKSQSKIQYNYPGQIDNEDIIENYVYQKEQTIQDSHRGSSNSNIVLKSNIIEKVDFEIIPAPVAKVLYSIYGGSSQIKRLIVLARNNLKEQVIEVQPTRIQLIFYPPIPSSSKSFNNPATLTSSTTTAQTNTSNSLNDSRYYNIYECRKQTLEQLKDRIQIYASQQLIQNQQYSKETSSVGLSKEQSLNQLDPTKQESKNLNGSSKSKKSPFDEDQKAHNSQAVTSSSQQQQQKQQQQDNQLINACRLWRIDSERSGLDTILKQQQQQQQQQNDITKNKILIDANLLDSQHSTLIEELDFTISDVVIFEYKQNEKDDWTFYSNHDQSVDIINECNFCGNKQELSLCECEQIKYCNQECQRKDRLNHKDICLTSKTQQKLKQSLITKYNISLNNNNYYYLLSNAHSPSINKGLCGLNNLGNTCFMNSSLQCLSNIQQLTQYMIDNAFIQDINQTNVLGTGGYLAAQYAQLIKDMWINKNDKWSVSPNQLKRVISQFAPQFSGYNQHDSSELLSYILDGLHEDLNKIKQKPIVQQIESDGTNDASVSLNTWNNYKKRNHSVIVDLFVALFKSTITCPSCKRVSVTFDPYMTISLPIPSIQYESIQVYIVLRSNVSQRCMQRSTFLMRQDERIIDLKKQIQQLVYIQSDISLFQEISSTQLEEFQDHTFFSEIKDKTKNYLLAFEKYNSALELDDDLIQMPYDQRLFDEQSPIQLQLNIEQFSKYSNKFESNSFKRVFFISQSTTIERIQLKLWHIFRKFLAPFLRETVQFEVNLEREDVDFLKQEYANYIESVKGVQELSYFTMIQGQMLHFQYNSNSIDSQNQFKQTLKDLITEKQSDFQFDENTIISISLYSYYPYKLQLNTYIEVPQPYKQDLNVSLNDCLELFIKEEVLEVGNEWYCSKCKDHQLATKRMEIYNTPEILIFHLKRFKANKYQYLINYYSSGQKIDTMISFPTEQLDLTKYVLSRNHNNIHSNADITEPLLYDLVAVSNHYGSSSGGHYTAYAKNHLSKKWYEFNDSSVNQIDEKSLESRAAYLLFYRKRQSSDKK